MQAAPATAPAAPQSPVAGAAMPTAAPASPQYTPPPTPMPSETPSMEDGGSVKRGGSIKDFFSDINVLDVVISAFIVGGVLYAVHYYKFMMMMEKTGYADLSSRVQKLESQIAAAKKKAEANATGGNGMMRRKRGLISI